MQLDHARGQRLADGLNFLRLRRLGFLRFGGLGLLFEDSRFVGVGGRFAARRGLRSGDRLRFARALRGDLILVGSASTDGVVLSDWADFSVGEVFSGSADLSA